MPYPAATTAAQARGEWRPGYMPRLSYKNAAPVDAELISPPRQGTAAQGRADLSSRPPSHTESPTFAPEPWSRQSSIDFRAPFPDPGSPTFQMKATSHKKRASFLGGLFAKETTAVALEQMAARIVSQHGSLSATAVPGVSSEKMPDYVPKVNSKWDGVPEAVRVRDQQERARSRRTSHRSSAAASGRSRSADRSRDGEAGRDRLKSPALDRRKSASTLSSFDSRGGAASGHHNGKASTLNHESSQSDFGSSIIDSILARSSKTASIRSQSLRSPSGTSLPEITSFFPDEIPATPTVPAKFRVESGGASMVSDETASTDRATLNPTRQSRTGASESGSVPERAFSPTASPRETSPATSLSRDRGNTARLAIHTKSKLNDSAALAGDGPENKATTDRKSKLRAGFLAGEARSFEIPRDGLSDPSRVDGMAPTRTTLPVLSRAKRIQQDLPQRPDSSRARLGLRASMLLQTDQIPWEVEEPSSERSRSPRLTRPTSPKEVKSKRLSYLGKGK